MRAPHLREVPKVAPEPETETLAERIIRMQVEGKILTKAHVAAFSEAMATVERMATEIADGGELYPPGVRDLSRRIAEEVRSRGLTLETLIGKAM